LSLMLVQAHAQPQATAARFWLFWTNAVQHERPLHCDGSTPASHISVDVRARAHNCACAACVARWLAPARCAASSPSAELMQPHQSIRYVFAQRNLRPWPPLAVAIMATPQSMVATRRPTRSQAWRRLIGGEPYCESQLAPRRHPGSRRHLQQPWRRSAAAGRPFPTGDSGWCRARR
jgi:hypothetical protein